MDFDDYLRIVVLEVEQGIREQRLDSCLTSTIQPILNCALTSDNYRIELLYALLEGCPSWRASAREFTGPLSLESASLLLNGILDLAQDPVFSDVSYDNAPRSIEIKGF